MRTKNILASILLLMLVITQHSFAQFYEWRMMNSTITKLYALPSNQSIIFAGDQSGLIRKSIDKGVTWKVVSMKAEAAINDIAFFDENIGVATGAEQGMVLVTRDGGETWNRKTLMNATSIPPSLFQVISQITIVDENTAYFHFGKYQNKQAIITRDAGLSFDTITVPGEIFKVSGDTLISLGFSPDMFGIKRFSIHRSINKGATWSLVKTSPTGLVDFDINGYNFVHFLNANTFYLTCGKLNKLLYKTSDGGMSFTTITKPEPSNFNKLGFLHFKNNNDGLAVLENDFSTAYYTTDGGMTWTAATGELKAPAVFTGADTYLAISKGVIASSADNGRSFDRLSSPIVTINQSPTTNFLKIWSDKIAYVEYGTLYEGCLVKTTDGGLTWKKMLKQNGSDFRATAYAFRGEDTLYHASLGTISYSTDGGLNSTNVFQYGFTPHSIKKLEFIDDNHAVAYAYGFTVFSKNGGQTWASKNTNISEPIDAAFPSVTAWYMLAGAKVYKSVDTGNVWTDVTSNMNLSTGGTNCNAGVYFINANEGLVYGCNGRVYKTTDGGATWVNIGANLPQNISFNDFIQMNFRTNTIGYASDPSAGVMMSTDAGTTWSAHGKVQSAGANKIDFKNQNVGAMLGSPPYTSFVLYVGPQNFTIDTLYIGQFTSVSASTKNEAFKVYPNPSEDILYFNTEDMNNIYAVFNLIGEKVQEGLAENSINIRDLPNGVYVLQLQSGSTNFLAKFIKK